MYRSERFESIMSRPVEKPMGMMRRKAVDHESGWMLRGVKQAQIRDMMNLMIMWQPNRDKGR